MSGTGVCMVEIFPGTTILHHEKLVFTVRLSKPEVLARLESPKPSCPQLIRIQRPRHRRPVNLRGLTIDEADDLREDVRREPTFLFAWWWCLHVVGVEMISMAVFNVAKAAAAMVVIKGVAARASCFS